MYLFTRFQRTILVLSYLRVYYYSADFFQRHSVHPSLTVGENMWYPVLLYPSLIIVNCIRSVFCIQILHFDQFFFGSMQKKNLFSVKFVCIRNVLQKLFFWCYKIVTLLIIYLIVIFPISFRIYSISQREIRKS